MPPDCRRVGRGRLCGSDMHWIPRPISARRWMRISSNRTWITSRSGAKRVRGWNSVADSLSARRPDTTLSLRCSPILLTICASTVRRCSVLLLASSARTITMRQSPWRMTLLTDSPRASAPRAPAWRPISVGAPPPVSSAHGRSGLPRTVRRHQGVELWSQRTGNGRSRVLYQLENVLLIRRLKGG